MIFCGIPVFLLEVSTGQFLGEGGMTTISRFCPMLKGRKKEAVDLGAVVIVLVLSGVGIATMVMVTYYNVYYCIVVCWALYYLIASFSAIPDLPWNTCGKTMVVMLNSVLTFRIGRRMVEHAVVLLAQLHRSQCDDVLLLGRGRRQCQDIRSGRVLEVCH